MSSCQRYSGAVQHTECQEWKEPYEAIWNSSEEETSDAEGRSTRVFNIFFHPPLLEGPPKDERMWVGCWSCAQICNRSTVFEVQTAVNKMTFIVTMPPIYFAGLVVFVFLPAPAQVSLDSRLVQESKLPASAAFVWDWSSVFTLYFLNCEIDRVKIPDTTSQTTEGLWLSSSSQLYRL